MTVNNFAFTPTDGLRNAVSFPTTPASEADARDQVQDISDQIRDYINTTIIAAINAKLDLSGGNLTGALASNSTLTGTALIASGLTGTTAASRYAGATTSGAPATGTFAKGDFVIDQTGAIWICTTAGTPGVWTKTATPAGAATIASGSYNGDATSSRTINIGFTPKFLFVSALNKPGSTAQVAITGYDGTAGGFFDSSSSGTSVYGEGNADSDVVYITTNGFVVKMPSAGLGLNLSATTYGWTALY